MFQNGVQHKVKKKLLGFLYSKNMPNYLKKAFGWNISSNINLLFQKSGVVSLEGVSSNRKFFPPSYYIYHEQYLLQNLERIVTDLWITFEKVQWREEKVCRLCIDFSIVLCKTYVYACVI